MKKLLLAAIIGTALATPTLANDHGEQPSLQEVLAHERREGDRHRDQFRNPAETMAFFRIEPTMTVAEFAPGGGWYTRILAPYLLANGRYVAVAGDSDDGEFRDRSARARALGWTERFKEEFADDYGVDAQSVHAFEIDEIPDDMLGTVDVALIIRALHDAWNGGVAHKYIREMRSLLKDGGLVGVVQHRAAGNASFADVNPAEGYMREDDLIKLMEISGFELVAKSEINANPKDPANWERGVWTLPPTLTTGEGDPRRAEYVAIGESDRMTLLFKKAD